MPPPLPPASAAVRWGLLLGLLAGAPALAEVAEEDPFVGITPTAPAPVVTERPWYATLFTDNFGLRAELMWQFSMNDAAVLANRHSLGVEVLKKFSTQTKTLLALNLQLRLVWRDGFVGTLNDMEGMNHPGFSFEYHNAFIELYDPLPTSPGRFNLRAGRFYQPFGLNQLTDTHGTLLQLSNMRNFGTERDWSVGAFGSLTPNLRYDVAYLLGSGVPLALSGQRGLLAARMSLSNLFASEHGVEGGMSVMLGERLDAEAVARRHGAHHASAGASRVETLRVGLDGRIRRAIPTGTVTWSSELSAGRDTPDAVLTQLHQLDYLHASRRWALSAQYRWFWQALPGSQHVDASVIGEATLFFSNDFAGSNLHWLKLNVEAQTAQQLGPRRLIATLQYYVYF